MRLKLIFLLSFFTGYSTIAEANFADSVFRISVNSKMLSAPEVLSLYIQHKSLSSHEQYAGDWLKSVCRENGLYIYEYGNEDANYNFGASLLPLENNLPNIILLNHIDVVDEGDSNLWIHPPFSGYISDTEVWGRGAFDNKGAAIMQLFSLLEYKSKYDTIESKYNVTFLAVSCEETMCDGGVEYVLNKYLHDLNPVVVIGEGATELSDLIEAETDDPIFGISVVQKRPLWLHLELSIPTLGHGSVTPLQYAIKEMTIALSNLAKKKTPFIYTKENIKILKAIGKQKSCITKFVLKHPRCFKFILSKKLRNKPEIFSLFTNTITITSINSNSGAINQIPNKVSVTLDCRLLPEYPQKKTIKFIQKKLKNDEISIGIVAAKGPTMASSIENLFYSHLESAIFASYENVTTIPIMLPNYNDVGPFRSKGIQGFSIIPIELDIEYLKCIHAENERIPIKGLYMGAKVYLKFLEESINK
ncbi:MAG: M20/M25/M40 family metallo-hydrolase [Bacteroidetes bacterium]|nr:M20/M25/M40 family metallo-hydrolase [Bacteroidota bacterium]